MALSKVRLHTEKETHTASFILGSSLGGVVYPVLLNNIFQRTSGFQWGVRSVAFMDLGFLIIANSIMRTRLPPKKRKADNSEPTASMRTVLKDIPFLVYTLGSFFIFWGVFVPFFYLQLYSSLHGVDAKFTKYCITVMNAASIFGRTVPNFVADHYGPLNGAFCRSQNSPMISDLTIRNTIQIPKCSFLLVSYQLD
jgi:Na+/melibiose symporter-like transporter